MVNYRTPVDWDQWVDQLAETLQTLRPACTRRGHSPQSDARPGRSSLSLWAYLGHGFVGSATSIVEYDWTAADRPAVRPCERHLQDSAETETSWPRSPPKVRQDRYQTIQDLPGDISSSRRCDPSCDCQGSSWSAVLLLHRSERNGRGDHRSLRGSRFDRTRLPRCEGSLGSRPTASASDLDQRRMLQLELVGANAGRMLGLEQKCRGDSRSRILAMGRSRSASVSRRSTKSFAPQYYTKSIFNTCLLTPAVIENTSNLRSTTQARSVS